MSEWTNFEMPSVYKPTPSRTNTGTETRGPCCPCCGNPMPISVSPYPPWREIEHGWREFWDLLYSTAAPPIARPADAPDGPAPTRKGDTQ